MATAKKKKKSKLPVIFFILIFIAGLSLLLYPTVSTLWNNVNQSYAMAEYSERINIMTAEEKQEYIAQAQQLNEMIYAKANGEDITNEQIAEVYNRALNLDGKGMMGILSIPKINVRLPIKHSTDEGVLQDAVGHVESSSLPIGGPNTHCALSGHTGLPSARLLTDLDQLQVGDYFVLEILGDSLYYQVDQINVVLPHQVSFLNIVPGMDLCTLITCTPYGVNSHRLLVRGVRVVTEEPIPDKVLAAGNPDYVPVLEPMENDIPPEVASDSDLEQNSGDLSHLTFNRNMPWWLRNVYTPIYIALGAVLLLLAGLTLPRILRRKKRKAQEANEEQTGETEQQSEAEEQGEQDAKEENSEKRP